MPDIKMLSAQPGIDPGYSHLQHFVLTTIDHLAYTPFLFYLSLSRLGWN
jgi:hypothetical protein